MYHLIERTDGTWALEQEDDRHASGRKELATGTKEAMEQLMAWYTRRPKVIFRINPEHDRSIERYCEVTGAKKQKVFDEAVEFWVTFAQDPEILDALRGAMSVAGSRSWMEVAYELCREWVAGKVPWTPTPAAPQGRPGDLDPVEKERLTWEEHVGKDPVDVWKNAQERGFDTPEDWAKWYTATQLKGHIPPSVRVQILELITKYIRRHVYAR